MKALLFLLALCSVAHAQATPRPRWMWSMGTMLRSTGADQEGDPALERLQSYGWYTHKAPLEGLRGDLAWLAPPIADLGFAWSWGRGTFASGPAYDDPDKITGSSLEAGAFARIHWIKPTAIVSAEPRLEAGVAPTAVTLRGQTYARRALYTKLGLDVRIGGRRAGALVTVDYTSIHRHDTMDMQLPAGGITFALSFCWRQW
jgi:hypothetical protein